MYKFLTIKDIIMKSFKDIFLILFLCIIYSPAFCVEDIAQERHEEYGRSVKVNIDALTKAQLSTCDPGDDLKAFLKKPLAATLSLLDLRRKSMVFPSLSTAL